jgi:tetratricopeptide (TPR) repeat protein
MKAKFPISSFQFRRSVNAGLLVFLLWSFAFALACRLLSMPSQQEKNNAGFADKILGGIRHEISGEFYEQADSVFHKGIGHAPQGTVPDWFARMRRQVAPYGHVHLHKEGILEIMPWLYFATRADSGNVNAYTVAAYWLAGEAGRPDLAEEVLNEALRNNPSDYRVYMEKGNLAMKEGKYKKAARFLDAAYARLPGTNSMDKVYPPAATRDQVQVDRAEILVYRGLLYEIQGDPENAVRCYRETVQIFPGRLNLKERMIELEKNGRSPTPPEKLAETLLFPRRYVCAEDEDE